MQYDISLIADFKQRLKGHIIPQAITALIGGFIIPRVRLPITLLKFVVLGCVVTAVAYFE